MNQRLSVRASLEESEIAGKYSAQLKRQNSFCQFEFRTEKRLRGSMSAPMTNDHDHSTIKKLISTTAKNPEMKQANDSSFEVVFFVVVS
jgi:hypothetical protein